MPVAMALAVVATANHYVVDVVIGVMVVLVALRLVQIAGRERTSEPDACGLLRPGRPT